MFPSIIAPSLSSYYNTSENGVHPPTAQGGHTGGKKCRRIVLQCHFVPAKVFLKSSGLFVDEIQLFPLQFPSNQCFCNRSIDIPPSISDTGNRPPVQWRVLSRIHWACLWAWFTDGSRRPRRSILTIQSAL